MSSMLDCVTKCRRTGWVIYAKHWNSKNLKTKSSTFDCVVLKERMLCNYALGYIVEFTCVGFDTSKYMFDTKKEAEAHLKSVKQQRRMGAESPVFYNACEDWWPDSFEFKVVKAEIELDVRNARIMETIRKEASKIKIRFRGTVTCKKDIPKSDRRPGDFWTTAGSNTVYTINERGKLTTMDLPSPGSALESAMLYPNIVGDLLQKIESK